VTADDPDGDLLAKVGGGDRRALEDLLRRHQPRLWALCRRMTGSDADADDATQEALISIVRALPRFDGRSRFSTWAYRIAVNASLDELRRRRRRPEPGLPGDHDVPGGAEPEATTPDPAGAALAVDVDAALRRLPPEFRAPVVLRDLCGLDYAEIAEVLGVPPGTVRSRISRGRAALAPLLAPRPERPVQGDPARPGTGLRAESGPTEPHPAVDGAVTGPSAAAAGSAAGPSAGAADLGNPTDPLQRPTPRP
jgi:RNA polymerase sigma-70 factor (ECF subfamily)